MKIKKMIEVTRFICDICGDECHNHTRLILADGTEMHGCDKYHEDKNKTCGQILKEKHAPKTRRSKD